VIDQPCPACCAVNTRRGTCTTHLDFETTLWNLGEDIKPRRILTAASAISSTYHCAIMVIKKGENAPYRDEPDRDDAASTSSAVLLGDFDSFPDEALPAYEDTPSQPTFVPVSSSEASVLHDWNLYAVFHPASM